MLDLEPIERDAIQMLLAGEHPILEILRQQFDQSTGAQRKFTGVGFFTDLVVDDDLPTVRKSRIVISDISAEVEGLEYGCGFNLFVEGRELTLECFLWAEDELPRDAKYTRLYYIHQPNPPAVEVTGSRDMEALRILLG